MKRGRLDVHADLRRRESFSHRSDLLFTEHIPTTFAATELLPESGIFVCIMECAPNMRQLLVQELYDHLSHVSLVTVFPEVTLKLACAEWRLHFYPQAQMEN